MQPSLFDAEPPTQAIPGLLYQADFLTIAEEANLLQVVSSLPLRAALYKQYTARRRIVSYGGSYDFDTNTLEPGEALDARLLPLRARVATWLDVPPEDLVHALVAEYVPGTPLGWHRDVPDFEVICGVSLGGEGRLRFRPYPHRPGDSTVRPVELLAQPRSIYKMEGAARWQWQHSVSPTNQLRWSITFRTAVSRRR